MDNGIAGFANHLKYSPGTHQSPKKPIINPCQNIAGYSCLRDRTSSRWLRISAFPSAPRARAILRQATLATRVEHPIEIIASYLLPEHLQCIWTLPASFQRNQYCLQVLITLYMSSPYIKYKLQPQSTAVSQQYLCRRPARGFTRVHRLDQHGGFPVGRSPGLDQCGGQRRRQPEQQTVVQTLG